MYIYYTDIFGTRKKLFVDNEKQFKKVISQLRLAELEGEVFDLLIVGTN
jgi:hypothetical protein